MTVRAPGDSPGNVYDPPPDVDPGMWARLRGYANALNPIGSANAAELQGPGPAYDPNHPEAGHPTNDAGQPLYAFPHLREALAGGAGDTNAPAVLPHLFGNGPNVQGRPILPYANPNTRAIATAAAISPDISGGSSGGGGASGGFAAPGRGGIGSDANAPVLGAGGFPTTYAPPGQQPAPPQVQQQQAAPPGVVNAPLPPPRPAAIDPRMRGEVAPGAAPAQSPWITTFSRPNQNPGTGGGMLGGALASPRGSGGPDQMGMLDLSGIFGGKAAAPAAAPAKSSTLPKKKIDAGKIPKEYRAEVPPKKKGPRMTSPYNYQYD